MKYLKNFCKCGCGNEIPFIAKNGYPQYYSKGHNKRGSQNNFWNGGKSNNGEGEKGYVLIKDWEHPFASKQHYVLEHRLVWEKAHNAILLPWADVHHKNKITTDNRPENLHAMMHGGHSRHHRLNPH